MKFTFKTRIAATVLSLGVVVSTGAQADSGTIVVTGQLLGQNCRVNGSTQDQDIAVNVALPTVSRTALRTAGSTTGLRPFRIALTECPAGTYYMHFEANGNTNLEQGTLTNATTGTNAATNVEVQLLNNSMQPIHIVTNRGSQALATTEGAANFDYYMRYISRGNATAGAFSSRLGFTLAYN